MDYYKTYMMRYLMADAEMRAASKNHWTKCHIENIASGREDLIVFSVKILGAIAAAEELI